VTGVTVLVDDREPAAVAAALRDHPDVARVEVDRLLAGDVVVGDVGFERKTLGDYVSTGMGRSSPDLASQVERLAEASAHAYVLLEDDLPTDAELDGGVSAAAVRGSMASITARLDAPVIPCGDLTGLVDMAVRIGRKHAEEPSPRPLAPSAVTARREPTTKRMYACIEGVGPETAQRLYEAFPSVASLLAASTAEILAVEGVGPKRATAIEAVVRTDAASPDPE
jgi:ERCC4-type nuclease